MQCNAMSDALYGGCKDTQCSAGGCGGSGREWEETAGGQDAQIQYNAKYKYKTHTNTDQRWKNVQTVQTRLCYFFSLAVLIFWLCTCKLDKTLC